MIIKEYDNIKLKINSIKKRIILPYLLNTYLVLENYSLKQIRDLRKMGKKLRLINGTQHQLLIKKQNASIASKLRIIDKIFKLEINGITLEDELISRFEYNHTPRKQFFNSVEYILILDSLCTFLISNHDNSDFITECKARKIIKYETFSYNELIIHQMLEKLVTKDEKYKPVNLKPKLQIRRWKKSKTLRMNELIKSLDKGYKAKWCYVNELNEFNFQVDTYKVKDEVYYKRKNGLFIFDQILVIDINNKLTFYDQDINKVENIYKVFYFTNGSRIECPIDALDQIVRSKIKQYYQIETE